MNVIDRKHFGVAAQCKHHALVPGRCLVTIITDGERSTIIVNVRFHDDIGLQQTSPITDFIHKHSVLSETSPLQHVLVVLGDFNIRFAKPIISIESQQASHKRPKHSKPAKMRFEHDCYSHFNAPKNHLNDIDHIFY